MQQESTSTLMIVAEVSTWLIPSLLALILARRCPPGARRPWAFIASVCGLFAIDELVDILGRGHRLAQSVAQAIDPNSLRGDTLIWRIVGLGLGGVLGLATMLFLFRGGRPGAPGGIPRWVAFGGLCVVGAYVVLRLIPRFGPLASGPAGWGILAVAWCLLVGGTVLEFDRLRDAED
ncbi:MAG: hypothetical protein ACI8QZ_003813 [Chlamydiales bacterium]|jgi:hypothetical protein